MQSDCNQQNQIGLRQDCQVIEGLHQNPGISTNCNQPSPIAPRIHPSSRNACTFAIPCNSEDWDRIADSMQSCFDPPARTQDRDRTPSGKQPRPPRLQLDCKTTKDCNVIGRIALKLHGLQVNRSNCTSHLVTRTNNPPNLLQSGLHAPVQMQD